MIVAQRISLAMRTELAPLRVGLSVAGFGVAHAHLHVIPMCGDQDVTSSVYARAIDGEVLFSASHVPLGDPDAQAAIAARLRQAMVPAS